MTDHAARISEKDIEYAVGRHGKKTGWLNYKFQSPNNRGVPDRIFMRGGTILFIEFKRPGAKPSRLQKRVHSQIREHGGFDTHVVDSIEAGIELLDRHSARLSETGR